MAFFPKVQSPCPYKSERATMFDGDMCRMCKRQVVDITDWSDAARRELIAGCKDEICVSYRIVRPALAAAALAAAMVPAAAAAQDQAAAPATEAVAPVTTDEINLAEQDIFMGGINDPANTEFASAEELAAIPEVPVTYEDEAPAPAAKPGR
jgi:predicted Fe-S protein YdhL (DUF1289 family)